jgi:hypothetical protein
VLDAMFAADELGVKTRTQLLDSTRLNGGLGTWQNPTAQPVLHLIGVTAQVRAKVPPPRRPPTPQRRRDVRCWRRRQLGLVPGGQGGVF